jgi:hypothetical protein
MAMLIEEKSVPLANITGEMPDSSASFAPLTSNDIDHSIQPSIERPSEPETSIDNELREICNDEDLREIDLNAVGDEFFLFSPRPSNDDELQENILHELVSDSESDSRASPTQTANRIFTMEHGEFDDFHVSSSSDPFGFDRPTSVMVTDLDDFYSNDQELLLSSDSFSNRSHRRPIQEDILYEVEHENSLSEHSQNASLIVPTVDVVSV